MEEPADDLEAPTSAPADAAAASGNGGDSDDDVAPDYMQLANLASRAKAASQGPQGEEEASSTTPFIPKRGEKDFEPTGFAGQNRALEASRKAMFDVIRCERYSNSKNISVATWEPRLERAIVHLSRGQAFASMGYTRRVSLLEDGRYEDLAALHKGPCDGETVRPAGTMKQGVFWPKRKSRLELYPEEALYLIERGSLECRLRERPVTAEADAMQDYDDAPGDPSWLPMSVEQAYATMLFCDGLTRERYQLYAYLRRLGYIVQRKSTIDGLRKASTKKQRQQPREESLRGTSEADVQGVIADPRHPLRLVSILDVLLYPLRRIAQLCGRGAHRLLNVLVAGVQWMRRLLCTSLLRRQSTKHSSVAGRGLLGIRGNAWKSYDAVFDRLRIVPTGHDVDWPAGHARQARDEVPEIFFYAWRPATHFRKTDPPLPEFQLAVVDARKTGLPSASSFTRLFAQLPRAMSKEDTAMMSKEERHTWQRAQEERKRNDESYGRGAVRKMKAAKAARQDRHSAPEHASAMVACLSRFLKLFTCISRLFAHLPPGCVRSKTPAPRAGPRRGPMNIYAPLKAGRRNVIVAVNDGGTASLVRFGEAEFARWHLAGQGR